MRLPMTCRRWLRAHFNAAEFAVPLIFVGAAIIVMLAGCDVAVRRAWVPVDAPIEGLPWPG